MGIDSAPPALTEAECRALLATQRLGRIGLSVGALPAIFPVSYRMDAGGIVVSPGDRSDLLATTHGGVVGFEVDDIDPDDGRGWSVLVVGLAKTFRTGSTGRSGFDEPTSRPERAWLLRIEPTLISGRSVATR